jgi:polyisoprenoid-binding protein YceI
MLKKVLLGLLAVVVALATGLAVWYLQLTAPIEVSSTPPAAATLVVAQTPAAGVTTTPQARVYRIDPARSWAAYRVDETFFDWRGLVIVTGTTSAVAGDILLDMGDPSASRVGEIVVDISQLATDEPSRDNAIRRAWLESARYPLARFSDSVLSGMPDQWVEGEKVAFQIAGNMTVRETTRPVTWDAQVTLAGSELRGRATTQLKMSQFGVTPPDMSSLRVEDDTTLTLEFVATLVEGGQAGAAATPGSAQEGCEPTAPGVVGFVPAEGFAPPVRSSVGTGHVLRGSVRSEADCSYIPNVTLVFWLANPEGQYDDEHRATVFTDASGRYTFESNFPGVYEGVRPHIHFYASAEGFQSMEFEYFPEEGQAEGTFNAVLRPAAP